jgi:serine/threonine protein kinase
VRKAVSLRVLDVLKDPSLHSEFLDDLEKKGTGKSCKSHDPCFVGKGTYAFAYKTCLGKNKCLLFKVKRPGREFDINEYKINQDAFNKLRGKSKPALVTQPQGVLGSSTNPLAFVFTYEENSVTLGEFIQKVKFSLEEFKAIIFQVVYVLLHLQKALPGFTHNDLHTDNVLVVKHASEQSFSFRNVKFRCKYSIRLIDFGQASTNARKTKDAQAIWGRVLGNTMVDFLRLANWMIITLYKQIRRSKIVSLQSCTSGLLLLLSNYVSKDCVKNGGSTRDTRTGNFLSNPWLCMNKQGEGYLNSLYSPHQKNAMELIIQDEFFTL